MNNREGVLTAMAETIPYDTDVEDFAAVLLALVAKGYRAVEIENDITEVMKIAQRMRGARNAVTEVAATAAMFGRG